MNVRHFGFRVGRWTNSPPQFGQVTFKISLAHREQKVHSKEQIVASLESIGKLASQRSQVLFISNIRSGSNRLDIVLTKLSI